METLQELSSNMVALSQLNHLALQTQPSAASLSSVGNGHPIPTSSASIEEPFIPTPDHYSGD